jgi:hypothetical protein
VYPGNKGVGQFQKQLDKNEVSGLVANQK